MVTKIFHQSAQRFNPQIEWLANQNRLFNALSMRAKKTNWLSNNQEKDVFLILIFLEATIIFDFYKYKIYDVRGNSLKLKYRLIYDVLERTRPSQRIFYNLEDEWTMAFFTCRV